MGLIICGKFKKRKFFFLRCLTAPAAAILFNVSFWRFFGWDLAPAFTYHIWPHVALFAVTFLITWFCYDIDAVFALFFQSLAFVIVHMYTNLCDLGWYLLVQRGGVPVDVMTSLAFLLAVLFCTAAYFLIARRIPQYKRLSDYRATMVVLAAVNIAFTVIFAQIVFANTLGSAVVWVLRIFLCVCLVVLPFILFSLSDSRAEKNMYEQMIIQADKYRRISRENIDAINRKYHDLKYRLAALKAEGGDEERNALIADLERDIAIYNVKADTGNTTLDVVLTEKGLLCNRYQIQFLCKADGACLRFMQKGDLYALLGNALDNAIEAAKAVQGERFISLEIASRGNMVNIRLENSSGKIPKMVDGLPQTSKEDKTFHGYGVRNIKAIVERYGGEMFIEAAEAVFSLTIFFAVAMQDAKGS